MDWMTNITTNSAPATPWERPKFANSSVNVMPTTMPPMTVQVRNLPDLKVNFSMMAPARSIVTTLPQTESVFTTAEICVLSCRTLVR